MFGESVLGGKIGEYSSSPMGQEYKAYKMHINPSAKGYVDLTLTGALKEGLTVKQTSQSMFLIYSVDEKYQKIGQKYGFEEFGLSDAEWGEMQHEIYAFIIEQVIQRSYAML